MWNKNKILVRLPTVYFLYFFYDDKLQWNPLWISQILPNRRSFLQGRLNIHIELHLISEVWTYKMVKCALSFIFEIIILKKKVSSFLSLQDWNVKFPDNSLTFWQNFIFPCHNFKFPDNSLTLKKLKIPWHFPDAYEPCLYVLHVFSWCNSFVAWNLWVYWFMHLANHLINYQKMHLK